MVCYSSTMSTPKPPPQKFPLEQPIPMSTLRDLLKFFATLDSGVIPDRHGNGVTDDPAALIIPNRPNHVNFKFMFMLELTPGEGAQYAHKFVSANMHTLLGLLIKPTILPPPPPLRTDAECELMARGNWQRYLEGKKFCRCVKEDFLYRLRLCLADTYRIHRILQHQVQVHRNVTNRIAAEFDKRRLRVVVRFHMDPRGNPSAKYEVERMGNRA